MLEIRRVNPEHREPLARLFARLVADGDDRFFHPHPLTAEYALRIADYEGRDLYYVLIDDAIALGYGMLRGWDEGFDVPSLGIAIAPEGRGTGLGRLFMAFLHECARRRGSTRIRLTVVEGNQAGRRLFTESGYILGEPEGGRLIGFRDL